MVSKGAPVAGAADKTRPPPVRALTLASWLGTFSVLGFSRMTEKHRSVSSFMMSTVDSQVIWLFAATIFDLLRDRITRDARFVSENPRK